MLREKIKGKYRWLGVPLAAALLTACGDDAAQPDNNAGGATTLSGSVFASYVDGASCNVLDINGNVIAGPVTTSASGDYSVTLPDSHLAENLVVECNNGTFVDEATGSTQTAGAMSAYIAGGTASVGTSVHVTLSTSIISALVEGGMSAEAAVNAFTAAFGFTPDYAVAPTDATAPEAGADNARLLAGLRAATFSQLASDLSIEQFDLIVALVADLADDGELNGNTTLPADIQNRFNEALLNFRNGNDETGLANSELGVLPFAKTAVTTNYKVTYDDGGHDAVNGKTAFTINVTDDSDVAVGGLDVSIDPLMNMDGREHATPYTADCAEMGGVGEYHCTVYYVMPSVMGMGEMAMSMGYWALDVTVEADEAVTFYPKVTMAMGDTAQVRLKGISDTIMAMGGDGGQARTYYLFKQGLSAAMGMGGGYELDLFIAANESMMSFPAIVSGNTLNDGSMMYALPLDTIVVEVSIDGVSWSVLDEGVDGRWRTAVAMALVDGEQAEILVKLTINGEQKTTDGAMLNNEDLFVDGAVNPLNNHFAVFKLTPGGGMMHMPM